MTHVTHASLGTLSDDNLLASVKRLTAQSNVTLAELLAHLGEVEVRGIHRLRACASLYSYCLYELRMSEDAAARRSKAARLVRQFPELREIVARGELHLTGLLMIGPYLGGERHAEVLQRARFRSKRELARLIARLDPKPEVAPRIVPIGPAPAGSATHAAFTAALAGTVRDLPEGERPSDWIEPDVETQASDIRDLQGPAEIWPERAIDPEPPLRYRVEFTAEQEYIDLVDEALDLLGHEKKAASLPDVQLRAMRELVTQLKKRRRAETDRPRNPRVDTAHAAHPEPEPEHPRAERTAPARDSTQSETTTATATATARVEHGEHGDAALAQQKRNRHIPAAARRAVWARDEARCAYLDCRDERCRETRGLQVHHRHAYALGGPPTVENLELRCAAHNLLAAEDDFGREHMDWVRGRAESIGRSAPARVE